MASILSAQSNTTLLVMVFSKVNERTHSLSTGQMKNPKTGYYTTHPPFDRAPSLVIGAVGPATIALQYAEVNLPVGFSSSVSFILSTGLASFIFLHTLSRLYQSIDVGWAGTECSVASALKLCNKCESYELPILCGCLN